MSGPKFLIIIWIWIFKGPIFKQLSLPSFKAWDLPLQMLGPVKTVTLTKVTLFPMALATKVAHLSLTPELFFYGGWPLTFHSQVYVFIMKAWKPKKNYNPMELKKVLTLTTNINNLPFLCQAVNFQTFGWLSVYNYLRIDLSQS